MCRQAKNDQMYVKFNFFNNDLLNLQFQKKKKEKKKIYQTLEESN